MRNMNRRKIVIAYNIEAFNVEIDSSRINGYKRLKKSDISIAIDKDGRTWYRAILEREDDMRYKIFGL